MVKNPPANVGDRFLGQEDTLEKGMAPHSKILENSMDRGAYGAGYAYGVAKSQT